MRGTSIQGSEGIAHEPARPLCPRGSFSIQLRATAAAIDMCKPHRSPFADAETRHSHSLSAHMVAFESKQLACQRNSQSDK